MIIRELCLILAFLVSLASANHWPASYSISALSGPKPFQLAWKQCAQLTVRNAMGESGDWKGQMEVEGGELLEIDGATFSLLSRDDEKRFYSLTPENNGFIEAESTLPPRTFCIAYSQRWKTTFNLQISPRSPDIRVQTTESNGKTHHSILRRQSPAQMFTQNNETGYCRCIARNLAPTDIQPQSRLLGCPDQPMSVMPSFDASRSTLTAGRVVVAAFSGPVPNRAVRLSLGGTTAEACMAVRMVQLDACRFEYVIDGAWEALKDCGWSAGTREDGYDVRSATAYLEWEDTLPGGGTTRNAISVPVTVRLPVEVMLSTSVSMPEESGVKNFTVESVSLEGSAADTKLIIRWSMESRWPNNLTLVGLTPPFAASSTIRYYEPPICNKTYTGPSGQVNSTDPFAGQLVHNLDGFTVNDWCAQSGTFAVDIGTRCAVGGEYRVAFDTSCFENAANNDCTGRVEALAVIGGTVGLDACAV